MDETFVNAIAGLSCEAAGRRLLGDTSGISPVAILPDGEGCQAIHSLEPYLPRRARFRGTFKTFLLAEFVAYAKRNPGGACFVDESAMSAITFFNLGNAENPGHGDWRASLVLSPTAAYQAACDVNGKRLSQKELLNWIGDWSHILGGENADGSVGGPITQYLPALRNLNIKATAESHVTDKDFGARRSKLQEIEANARGDLPAIITMACVPYLGFAERKLSFRLQILPDDDDPKLTLRQIGREQLVEDLATEFKTRLLQELGDDAEVSIGTFSP